MKRFVPILILFFVLSFPVVVMAGSNSITIEFDNRASKWSPRLMLLANPVEEMMVDIRKGIGGSHLQILSGWNFNLGQNFVITPYVGVGLDDKDDLRPIYAQAEVITFAKAGLSRNVFIASYSLSVHEPKPDVIYFQEKAWLQLTPFCVGFLTDIVILPKDGGEISFWRLGVTAGYALTNRVMFTLWPNYEFQSESWGFRAGTTLKF